MHCDRWHPRSQLVIVDVTTGFQLALNLISSFSQLHVKSRRSCLRGNNKIQNAFPDPNVHGFNLSIQSPQTKWLVNCRAWLTLVDRRISLVASSNNVASIIRLHVVGLDKIGHLLDRLHTLSISSFVQHTLNSLKSIQKKKIIRVGKEGKLNFQSNLACEG